MLSRLTLKALLTLFACLAGALSAQAQLIAYEGFDYAVAKQTPRLWPVTNKSPDGQPLKYFTELDTHAQRAPYDYTMQVMDGSIPTAGSAFPFQTKGNSLSWAREWLDAFGTIDPNFQFDTSRDNPPIYVSFLIRANKSANPVRQIALAFSNGSSQRLQAGVDDMANSGQARFFGCVASPQPTREYLTRTMSPDTTYFIVAKFTTSATRKDMVSMNVYGPGDKVPGDDRRMSWQLEVGDWTDFLVTDIAITLNGGEAGSLLFDELRIGSNWEAVAVNAQAKPTPPATTTATNQPSDPQPTEGDAAAAESLEAAAEESSPLVLGLIGAGLLVFILGGAGFYLFVIKPGKSGKPQKPKSAPKPISKPPQPEGAKPEATAEAPKPAAPKPAAPASKPQAPEPRKPKKPPPPR